MHLIGGKEHPIQGLPDAGWIPTADQQPGSGVIEEYLGEAPQAPGGGDAAGGDPAAGWAAVDGGAGLAVQKPAGVWPVQPDQAGGLLDPARACGLPVPGARLHDDASSAASSAAKAATSASRNRLRISRPAACIASWPPSWRSTIVTTRSTR